MTEIKKTQIRKKLKKEIKKYIAPNVKNNL